MLSAVHLFCRDYDEEKKTWGWTRAPPTSQKMGGAGTSEKGARKKASASGKLYIRLFVKGRCYLWD